MRQEKIQRVSDNNDKRNTYRVLFEKYNRAMSEEFYLEAIVIAYAIMEDRITRFLYHAGLIEEYPELKLASGEPQRLADKFAKDGEVRNIKTRISMLRRLSVWATETERKDLDSEYEIALIDQVNGSVDLSELNYVLDRLPDWIDGRNECIHSLAKKNADSAEQEIKKLADDSYRMIRILDSVEREFKGGNALRESFCSKQ